MKKKLVSVLLTASMVAALVGCGGGDSSTSTTDSSSSTTDTTASTDTSTADTTETPAAETTDNAEQAEAEPAGEYQLDKIVMVVDGTLTATVDNGQADFEKQWEDAVGVDLEIQQLDHSGYKDAVGRLFAGGDLPDVMVMSADMYAQYSNTGILWDMTDAYNNAEFQARMTKPEVNDPAKKGGKIYGFSPAYGNGCVTYVKKAWLDALGIDPATITNFDAYYDMLLRFHNEDPDGNGKNGDTYGVVAAGYMGNEAPYINYMPEFWQNAYPAILQDENGVWYDGFQTQETKDALLRIQKGVAEGAIDPESLTASTKIAREKWFSNNQEGSAGVFTYWAGTWYQNLTDSLIKNEVNEELVMLPPIAEVGAYLNREAPVWCIIDDQDGDNAREQAVFDKFIDTMLDGGTVQMLWTYGAEDVHWSTHAEEFTTNADDPEKKKDYKYEEGEFHLKQSPNDPNTVWKKNHIDNALVICPLSNPDYISETDLAAEGNKFFLQNCVDAPLSPSSETLTNESGTIYDAKLACITTVVQDGGDVDAAMETYVATVGATIDQILSELNAAE